MNTPPKSPNRYIGVASLAVFRWLSQDVRSPERDLIECLLAADPRQPFALDALARALGQAATDTGRLLFALNRRAALSIACAAPAPPPQTGLEEGVALALQQLTESGGAIVLADGDGLLLAQAGSSTAVAEHVAAGLGYAGRFAALPTLHFGRQRLTLFVSGPVRLKHPAWIALARLLQRSAGALSFGMPACT